MATLGVSSSTHPLPKDSDPESPVKDEIQQFISTLPTRKNFSSFRLHKFKGFWIGSMSLPGLIESQNNFKPQENDVVLATMHKSGTTWLKALLFTLLNRKSYPVDRNHPLLRQNPHALVPFIELSSISSESDTWGGADPPVRLLSTHAPLPLLPDALLGSGCKIVYLCRNLKDVFVSHWHFINKLGVDTSLEELFDMYCEGISHCGPVWDHVLGYWKESLERPEKVMFLGYEDMKEQPEFQLKRMAEFAGCPITAEEEEQGLVDEILGLCSFRNLSNLEVNQKGKWWIMDNHSFFRKGEVGDWKNYLTDEMAQRFDQITAQKFHGSGLKL